VTESKVIYKPLFVNVTPCKFLRIKIAESRNQMKFEQVAQNIIRKLCQNPQAKHISLVFKRKAPLLFHAGSAQAGVAPLG
jgi:hypothetical protein